MDDGWMEAVKTALDEVKEWILIEDEMEIRDYFSGCPSEFRDTAG